MDDAYSEVVARSRARARLRRLDQDCGVRFAPRRNYRPSRFLVRARPQPTGVIGLLQFNRVQFLYLAKGPTLMLIQLSLCHGVSCMALSEIRHIAAERFSPCHGMGRRGSVSKAYLKVWWIISVCVAGHPATSDNLQISGSESRSNAWIRRAWSHPRV
jgi:hypothetical protein